MMYKTQKDNKSCGAIAIQNMEICLMHRVSNISEIKRKLKINENDGVFEKDYIKFLRKK